MIIFVYRLRDLRNQSGLSAEKVGQKIGVSRYSIGAWERGENLPTLDKAILLASLFSVSIDYLLGVSDIPNAETLLHEVRKNAGTHVYEGLTDPQRMAVETLVETFRQANDKKKTELSGTSEVGK